jgi:hypothetical protein
MRSGRVGSLFTIDWHISDETWRKASAAFVIEHDRVYDLLIGCLQISSGDVELFPALLFRQGLERYLEARQRYGLPEVPIVETPDCDSLMLSLADFSSQMASIIEAEPSMRADEQWRDIFSDSEGGVGLDFQRRGDAIEIISGMEGSPTISVPIDTFLGEFRRFLTAFTHEAERHVPGILAWDVFRQLRQYKA